MRRCFNVVAVSSASRSTVLVLEENAAVQELIDQTLRDTGHRVLSTGNVLEALGVLRRVRVHVLVLGLIDVERDDELCRVQPEVRVVTLSPPDEEGLPAPFSLDELADAVAGETRP